VGRRTHDLDASRAGRSSFLLLVGSADCFVRCLALFFSQGLLALTSPLPLLQQGGVASDTSAGGELSLIVSCVMHTCTRNLIVGSNDVALFFKQKLSSSTTLPGTEYDGHKMILID